jgi:hypothetical protein
MTTTEQPLYEKCAHCHLFIEANYNPDDTPGLAEYVHLHRGDDADEQIDETHEAKPSGQVATLAAWKQYGPPEMRARFIDDGEPFDPEADELLAKYATAKGIITWVRRAANGTILVDVDTNYDDLETATPEPLIVSIDDRTVFNTARTGSPFEELGAVALLLEDAKILQEKCDVYDRVVQRFGRSSEVDDAADEVAERASAFAQRIEQRLEGPDLR